MFALSSKNRFHLYSQPTDMSKSFDGLSGLVQNILGRNPTGGDVFIFINKRRDKIKLLHWQGAGFILYYKRIEKGTSELLRCESSAGCAFTHAGCNSVFSGLSVSFAFAFSVESRKPIID